jgi:hypothetical protein
MSPIQMLLSNLDSAGVLSQFSYPHSTSKTAKIPSVIRMGAQVSIFPPNLLRWGITRLTSHPYRRSRSRLVDLLLILVEGDRHV